MNNCVKLVVICVISVRLSESSVFVTDQTTSKVIEFSKNEPYCQVHTDIDEITELLQKFPKRVSVVDSDALLKMEGPCDSRKGYGFIYPGTLWCGQGTKAFDFSQLGVHSEEDKCCREHDNCFNYLEAGECRGDICNDSLFTRSHCDCDRRFQDCLRNTGTETGNTIGAIFFNVVQVVCFRETNCTEAERVPAKENALNLGNGENSVCPIHFTEAARYISSEPFFTLKNKKAFILNLLLRKFSLLRK